MAVKDFKNLPEKTSLATDDLLLLSDSEDQFQLEGQTYFRAKTVKPNLLNHGAMGFHLGSGNERGTDSGLVDGFGSFDISTNKQHETPILFKLLDTSPLPSTIQYNPLSGQIILPAGNWVLCVSSTAENNAVNSGNDKQNVSRELSYMTIKYGDNYRHGNTKYLRYSKASAEAIDGLSSTEKDRWVELQGYNSIAGSVSSNGITPVEILFGYLSQADGGTIDLTHAHIHGFQQ